MAEFCNHNPPQYIFPVRIDWIIPVHLLIGRSHIIYFGLMGENTGINLSEADALKLIHELQAYRKELEQENEKLISANKELLFQNDEYKKRIDNSLLENNNSERQKEDGAKFRQSFLINSLLDAIPDVIFLKDSAGIYLECNSAFIKRAGKTKDEIIGKTDFDIFDKTIADTFRANDIQIITQNKAAILEESIFLPDGEEIPFEMRKLPYSPGNGSAIGILGIGTDISERRRNEQALLQINLRHSAMISNISDVIGIVGADGLMKYKSPNIARHFGWLPEDRIGTSGLSCIHPDEIEYAQKSIGSLLDKDNSVITLELRYECKDGSYKPIELFAVNMMNHPLINGILIYYRDISERKQSEIAIRESGKKWEAMIEASPDGIALVSLDGRLEFISDNYALLHGYTIEEKNQYLGKSVFDFVDPSDHQLLTNTVRGLLSGEIENSVSEYIAIRKDQSRFNLGINSTILRDINEKPENILTIGRDITERKQAEAALQKSKELYKKLVQTVPDMIIMTDNEGNITFANDKVLSVLGNAPKENIYDRNMFSFIAEQDIARALENKNLMFDKPLGAIEYQLKFEDLVIDTEVNGEVIRDSENNPSGFVFVIRNITSRKRSEEEKRISDSKILTLSMAIEQSPVNIVITDTAGNIEFVNPKFIQTTGYTAKEVIGKNPRILKGGATPDSEYKKLWDTILSGQSWQGIFQNKKKNGELYWESAVISPVNDNEGTIVHFIAIKEDITERKKSEEALLKAKAEAESANRSKSTFLANMSHEIRTPLNAIIGFSQLMNREQLSPEQQGYALSIHRSGEHLLKLINDILELSKIEAGRFTLNPSNVDLFTLIDDLKMMFREQALAKRLQLIFETTDNLPQYLIVDENKLRQIFINLIGNALKFTNEGGIAVRIRLDPTDVESGRLVAEIEDSGPGISEKELGNLFRHFEQASAGIRTSSGTGLGLALSRELAGLMGGNITVTSEEGKGSVFTFNVAVKKGVTIRHGKINTKRIIGIMNPEIRFRILVVDDKEENRKVASDLLKSVGFDVNEAVNGKEAIAIFEHWNPHLVLMDMRMPVMDGYEATRRIKSTEKGKQIPVVAITASLFEDDKAKAIEHDINGYIRKPFRENELYFTIGQILGIDFVTEKELPDNPASRYLNNPEALIEDMAKLPKNLRTQILDTVEAADFHQLIDLIRSIFSDNQELADHLIALANNYDYTRLTTIFKNGINE